MLSCFLTADSGGKAWGHMGTALANAEDTPAWVKWAGLAANGIGCSVDLQQPWDLMHHSCAMDLLLAAGISYFAASCLWVCVLRVLPAAQLNVQNFSAERRVPPGNSGEQLFHSRAAKVVLFQVLCFSIFWIGMILRSWRALQFGAQAGLELGPIYMEWVYFCSNGFF